MEANGRKAPIGSVQIRRSLMDRKASDGGASVVSCRVAVAVAVAVVVAAAAARAWPMAIKKGLAGFRCART